MSVLSVLKSHSGVRKRIEEASDVTGATIWKHATTLLKILGEGEAE